MEKSYIKCICNHDKWQHVLTYGDGSALGDKHLIEEADACAGIVKQNKGIIIEWCQCPTFKRDNLKYLEMLSKEKENV